MFYSDWWDRWPGKWDLAPLPVMDEHAATVCGYWDTTWPGWVLAGVCSFLTLIYLQMSKSPPDCAWVFSHLLSVTILLGISQWPGEGDGLHPHRVCGWLWTWWGDALPSPSASSCQQCCACCAKLEFRFCKANHSRPNWKSRLPQCRWSFTSESPWAILTFFPRKQINAALPWVCILELMRMLPPDLHCQKQKQHHTLGQTSWTMSE